MSDETTKSLKEKIGDALFTKVSDYFTGMFQMVWKDSKDITDNLADSIGEKVKKGIVAEGDPEVKAAFIKSLDQLNLSPEVKDLLVKDLSNTSNSDIALTVVKVIALALGGFLSLGSEAMVPWIQDMRKWVKATIPDPSQAHMAFIKNPELLETVSDIFERSGLDDKMQEIIKESARTTLPPDIIKQLFFRGIIDEATVDEMLKTNALNDEDAVRLKESFKFLPGVQDIITMAVREVFTPEVAAQFGQFDDYPDALTEHAKKVGVSEEWAKNYWAAHWDLPSIQAGYTMLHRGVINDEQLDMLLRAKDVMPFWREKLKQISYSPYTRVDVRRMFTADIITEEQVKESYLAQGYDEEHATNLTNWTIQSVIEEEREPTKTDIVSAFKRGAISQEDAVEMLVDLGYNQKAIALTLSKAIYDNERTLTKQRVSALKSSYIRGTYNESETRSSLSALNLDSVEINSLLDSWDIQKLEVEPEPEIEKVRTISKAEIISLYKSDSISQSEAKQLLTNLNYDEKTIKLLLAKADYDNSKKIKGKRVNAIRKTYLKGIFNDNDVITKLKAFEVDEKEIQSLLNVWDIEKLEAEPSEIIEKERSTTKNDLLASFNRNLITQVELRAGLFDLNYNEFTVNLLTTRAEYDKVKILKDDLIKSIKKGYIKGIYSEENTRDKLLEIGLLSAEIEHYFILWDIERASNEPTLSVAIYSKAYKQNIITLSELRIQLEQKGYSDQNINILIKLVDSGMEDLPNE